MNTHNYKQYDYYPTTIVYKYKIININKINIIINTGIKFYDSPNIIAQGKQLNSSYQYTLSLFNQSA